MIVPELLTIRTALRSFLKNWISNQFQLWKTKEKTTEELELTREDLKKKRYSL